MNNHLAVAAAAVLAAGCISPAGNQWRGYSSEVHPQVPADAASFWAFYQEASAAALPVTEISPQGQPPNSAAPAALAFKDLQEDEKVELVLDRTVPGAHKLVDGVYVFLWNETDNCAVVKPLGGGIFSRRRFCPGMIKSMRRFSGTL